MSETSFRVALLAGGIAGTSVDVTLFPIDTVKTRLQSQHGFWKAGGFRGIYSGLLPVTLGSAPTAALFFCTYELTKSFCRRHVSDSWMPVVHMGAASIAEITACLLRVPVEVVKQRAQACHQSTSLKIFRKTIAEEGFRGLYRGYRSTMIREVPFSFIQFPIWEYLKVHWSKYQNKSVDPWQSSVCGSVAGCIGAGITTPLDVAKTRIMLAERSSPLASGSILLAIRMVVAEKGIKGMFAGILPRILWISIGGAVFLGVYDKAKLTITSYIHPEMA